jgi:hypothetical protein
VCFCNSSNSSSSSGSSSDSGGSSRLQVCASATAAAAATAAICSFLYHYGTGFMNSKETADVMQLDSQGCLQPYNGHAAAR